MHLRTLKHGDSEYIIDLLNCSGNSYISTYNNYIYWILENYYSTICFVIEEDNKFIGFVSGMPSINRNLIFLWQICVRDNYRNKGIGRLLLDTFVEKSKILEVSFIEFSITLENDTGIHLFKSYADSKNIKMVEKKIEDFNNFTATIYQYQL